MRGICVLYLYLDLVGCTQLRGQWRREQTVLLDQYEASLQGTYSYMYKDNTHTRTNKIKVKTATMNIN